MQTFGATTFTIMTLSGIMILQHQFGIMTLRVGTLSITTLDIIILSMTTLSIMTHCIVTFSRKTPL